MAKRRTVVVESIGVRRKVGQWSYRKVKKSGVRVQKGGMFYVVRVRYFHTLVEGDGKPQFTFSDDSPQSTRQGERWRVDTVEWDKKDPFAYPTYTRVR